MKVLGIDTKNFAKNVFKGGSKKKSRLVFGRDIPMTESFLEKQFQEFQALNFTLIDRFGSAMPPFDPYILLTLLDNDGYLSRANVWKANASVGYGYECSDALRAHLKRANERESFQHVLNRWALDVDDYGNGYVEIVKSTSTVSFYHMSALKTRVRPFQDGSIKFNHFEYGVGKVAVQVYDDFGLGIASGVRQYRLPSRRGNRYYGEPEYTSATTSLELNVDVKQVAKKYFQNSLISDMAIKLKGAELDPEEREQIRSYLSSAVRGVENAHKILFFEIGATEDIVFEKLNGDIKDASFGGLRNTNREEIVTTTGVPPRLLGIITAGSLGGVGEVEGQIKIFKLGAIDPRQPTYEEFWQCIFEDAGLPDPESFKLKRLDVNAGAADVPNLAQGVEHNFISPQEAHDEWVEQKGARTNGATRTPLLLPSAKQKRQNAQTIAADFIDMLGEVRKGVSFDGE